MPFEFNEFGQPEIPSDQLRANHIPAPRAAFWPAIADFALTFDGYTRNRTAEECDKISKRVVKRFQKSGVLPKAMNDLRTCLFMQQRMLRHWDSSDPETEHLEFIHEIVEAIRTKVQACDYS